ncbi:MULTISPECIES: glycosyltransferase [unclassified Pseudomonas]|uniref:glycosyltransferase n=1 Tax=unclassified Pseudomonas TaxID=196821 RepID=UPI002446EC3F|nr:MULTISPECIES: glycosyltransferase [unclassified Pseudomonas]MDH0896638.1 glycosyltransferase [Pseudomonas sp. GD03875]MDH1066421.1 glycosyltransferase [Pseudomonas sp. GD03985]
MASSYQVESASAQDVSTVLQDSVLTVIVPLWGEEAQIIRCVEGFRLGLEGTARSSMEVVLEYGASSWGGWSEDLQQAIMSTGFRLVERKKGVEVVESLRSILMAVEEGDVLLLDAGVDCAGGLVNRLRIAARSRFGVGVVVPFSSRAGLYGVPAALSCDSNVSSRFGAAAAEVNAGVHLEVPLGMGPCLFLTGQCINLMKGADFSFSLGYGGESGLGFQVHVPGLLHLLACDAFAGCLGSGGIDRGGRLTLEWMGGRAGGPDVDVARWLRFDPACIPRIALTLQAIRSAGLPVILQVLHRIGGGVERHVKELVGVSCSRAWSLVMRPMAGRRGVSIALDASEWSDRLVFKLPDESKELTAFLRGMGVCRIHVHHALGFHPSVWGCLGDLGVDLDLTLHDYTIIQGSPTLTGRQGGYIGAAAPVGAYEMIDAEQSTVLRALVARSARCFVPSEDMKRRLQESLPSLVCSYHAHPDREIFGAYPAPVAPRLSGGEPLRVLCLGALGREKGMEVLRDVALLARGRKLPISFMLLGSAHMPLGGGVQLLGKYSDSELAELLERHRPHVVWFPVRCPETWSYTLSAALEAGLPILASAIGALPERLQGRPLTWLSAHDASTEDWLEKLAKIDKCLRELERPPLSWLQEEPQPFYRECYAANLTASCLPPVAMFGSGFLGRHGRSPWVPLDQSGWRRKLLLIALRARAWAPLAGLLSCVPYNMQRRIKRFLSVEPLH